MDKYEYRVKTEQLLEYTEKKQYRKAMEIADTIDWRRVKSASMLNTVSEVYEYCGEFRRAVIFCSWRLIVRRGAGRLFTGLQHWRLKSMIRMKLRIVMRSL